MEPSRIALIGDFNPAVVAHRAIPAALRLASARAGCAVEPVWVGTASLGEDVAAQLAPTRGSRRARQPLRQYARRLEAIRFARQTGRPFLGTCGGFQHALLEYARNVLGLRRRTCRGPARRRRAVDRAAFLWLVERAGEIVFREGSRLRDIYGAEKAEEEYHCRYGLNSRYEQLLEDGPLKICGRDRAGEVRAVELEGHPFFLATLFQPERAGLRGEVHPLVNAFVAAVGNQECGRLDVLSPGGAAERAVCWSVPRMMNGAHDSSVPRCDGGNCFFAVGDRVS